MKLANVASAFRQHLLAWPDRPASIVWDGGRTDRPTTDSPLTRWVRESLLPSASNPSTIGPTPLIRTEGVYLLDLYSPASDGRGPLAEWADQLMAHFCVRTELLYSGTSVTLLSTSQLGKSKAEPGWIAVSVTINWRSDTTNPL